MAFAKRESGPISKLGLFRNRLMVLVAPGIFLIEFLTIDVNFSRIILTFPVFSSTGRAMPEEQKRQLSSDLGQIIGHIAPVPRTRR
jgi:hypothetical protein